MDDNELIELKLDSLLVILCDDKDDCELYELSDDSLELDIDE